MYTARKIIPLKGDDDLPSEMEFNGTHKKHYVDAVVRHRLRMKRLGLSLAIASFILIINGLMVMQVT